MNQIRNYLKGAVAVATIVTLTACEQPQPEEQLAAAAEDVADAREAVAAMDEQIETVKDDLQSRKKAVEKAETELAEARQNLREMQKKLAEEKADLDSKANDVAVFRLLQRNVLEEPELANAAIGVRVTDGVVVLFGDVDNESQAKLAEDMAKKTPGVDEVRNFIAIESSGASE